MDKVFPEWVRAWLYTIGMAVIPLMVAYGLLDEGTSGLWVGVLGAVLGFGSSALAAANTSTKRDKGSDSEKSNGYPS